jgi:hypothetical protein
MPRLHYGLLFTASTSALWDLWRYLVHANSPFLTGVKEGSVITYPQGLWNSQRSLIMFPTQHSGPKKVFAVMVKIRVQRGPSLIMSFAIRIRKSGEALWFCRLPPQPVRDDVEYLPIEQLEGFKKEVSDRTEGIMFSGHRGFHLDILSEQNISSDTVVRSAHLSTEKDSRKEV